MSFANDFLPESPEFSDSRADITSYPGRQLPILIEKWLRNTSAPAPGRAPSSAQSATETTIVSPHHRPGLLLCISSPVAVVGSGTAQGGAGAAKSPWPWGLESCREKNLCQRGVGGGEPDQQAGKKPKAQCGQFSRRSWEHVKQHSRSCFKHFSGLNPAGHFHTS